MGDDNKRSPLVKYLKYLNDQFKNGLNFDSIVTTNKELLHHYLPYHLAFCLHFIFCWFAAHVRIFMALISPIASLIPQQRGNWKLTDAFNFCRTEFTLILLALSAVFHFYSIPAFLKPFNWAFTLRPQINVKPRMTMVAKRSQSDLTLCAKESELSGELLSSSTKSKSMANLADIQDCDTEVDLGTSLKIREGITDKCLSLNEHAIDTYSIASSLSIRTIETDDDASSFIGSDFESDVEELNGEDLAPCDNETFVSEFDPFKDDDEFFSAGENSNDDKSDSEAEA